MTNVDVGRQLVVFEDQMRAVRPHFDEALGGRMPTPRLIRTIMICVERTPKLLQCNRQSLLNSGITFGVLALECDGVTGQGHILPFKQVAQPVIGYKGYNTIGARAGLTITGDVVRDGDSFDYRKGTGAFVHHKPLMGNRGAIIGAWAQAEARDRPPVIEVLDIQALEAVRLKSPGAKMADSPWNDREVGLPAMYSKTAKRRLARSTPMNWAEPAFMQAAALEEAFDERGRTGFIAPGRGVVIDGGEIIESGPTPKLEDLSGPAESEEIRTLKREGLEAATLGRDIVAKWWERLSPRLQVALKAWKETDLKPAIASHEGGAGEGSGRDFLEQAINKLAGYKDEATLEGASTEVKRVLAGELELLGEWNAARLRRLGQIKAQS